MHVTHLMHALASVAHREQEAFAGVVAMLRRCCVFQCEGGFLLFGFPKEKTRNP